MCYIKMYVKLISIFFFVWVLLKFQSKFTVEVILFLHFEVLLFDDLPTEVKVPTFYKKFQLFPKLLHLGSHFFIDFISRFSHN
jgi:hypothetical protein